MWLLLSQLPFGRELYAVGMNRESSRLMGARTRRDIYFGFAVSGMLAAMAGILELGLLQSAQPTIGVSLLLPALAVAFLGASTIRPGWFNVWGTLIGVLVVQTGIVGLDDMGVPFWVQPVFDGVVLIVAVAVSALSFAPMRNHLARLFKGMNPEASEHPDASPG